MGYKEAPILKMADDADGWYALVWVPEQGDSEIVGYGHDITDLELAWSAHNPSQKGGSPNR